MIKTETLLFPIRHISARVDVALNVEKDISVTLHKIERFWIGDKEFNYNNERSKSGKYHYVWDLITDALEEMDLLEEVMKLN
jgi:hypothetical protein|tara:strand:+ start:9883 stop:10128 length:246 start_codon:yes stop_codon:yes gene_type:complete